MSDLQEELAVFKFVQIIASDSVREKRIECIVWPAKEQICFQVFSSGIPILRTFDFETAVQTYEEAK